MRPGYKTELNWKKPFQGKNMLDIIFITLALILLMENFRKVVDH